MRTSFSLPQEALDRLESLSKETGKSKNYYIRQAVLEYLKENGKASLAEEWLEEEQSHEVEAAPSTPKT